MCVNVPENVIVGMTDFVCVVVVVIIILSFSFCVECEFVCVSGEKEDRDDGFWKKK